MGDRFGNKFTGHKDTDRLVLLNLNGKDLLSFCSSTPHLNDLCNEDFFNNKIKNTPLEHIKIKYPTLNYRNFYATMMYYIALLQEEYNYKYNFAEEAAGDPKIQYQLLKKYKKDRLLIQAAISGELGLVKYLIETEFFSPIHSALIHAAENGRLEVVN